MYLYLSYFVCFFCPKSNYILVISLLLSSAKVISYVNPKIFPRFFRVQRARFRQSSARFRAVTPLAPVLVLILGVAPPSPSPHPRPDLVHLLLVLPLASFASATTTTVTVSHAASRTTTSVLACSLAHPTTTTHPLLLLLPFILTHLATAWSRPRLPALSLIHLATTTGTPGRDEATVTATDAPSSSPSPNS
jgi:hypothetical protein